jgi:uncharacterized protein YbjT (DUF2867 family)
MRDTPPLLVTGATGYVGGRLVGRLLEVTACWTGRWVVWASAGAAATQTNCG